MKKREKVNLNPKLIERQELVKKDIVEIQKLHRKKNKLFENIRRWKEYGLLSKVKGSAKKLENIEFKMQKAWKFNQDYTRHTHWFQNPACNCPKMDNFDFAGWKIIYAADCPLHGHLVPGVNGIAITMVSDIEDKSKGLFH